MNRAAGVRRRLLLAVLVVAGLPGLSGCRGPADAPVGSARSAAATSGGHGAEFLAVGECSSFGTTSFTEVPCG